MITIDANTNDGKINLPDIILEWTEPKWDSIALGFTVLHIYRMEVNGGNTDTGLQLFKTFRNNINAKLVSCRLSTTQLRESIILEKYGFRFIEMTYQPIFKDLQNQAEIIKTKLSVYPAIVSDIPKILEIASVAFSNERFHVDPRIDSALANKRYCTWVKNTIMHPSQKLYIIKDKQRLIAFFITEMLPNKTCYWHLNAITPGAQGQGYGKLTWYTMLNYAKTHGAKNVQSSFTARNHRVLNLYARLGFHFPVPQMTFQWVGTSQSI